MLITCATWNYWDLLQPLLISHNASNPDRTLHVHAIDWPSEAITSASETYPNARFYPCTPPSPDGKFETLGPVPRSAAILKLKVQLLKEHYDKTDEPNGDFAVTYRSNKRNHAKFAVAVLCFTRTKAAKTLLEAYAADTEASTGLVKKSSTDGVAWFHDQLALWECYRLQSRYWFGLPKKGGPRLVPLTEAEHSIDGSTDAIFASRRDGVLDLVDMERVLEDRGMN